MTNIGDAVYQKADEDLHIDLVIYAESLVVEYYENAPRIDTGEGWVSVEEKIERYRQELSKVIGIELRPIRLEPHPYTGRLNAVLDPLPPLD